MENYKKEFIEFMVDCQVLKFGDFVTKSGRKTPFFVKFNNKMVKLMNYEHCAFCGVYNLIRHTAHNKSIEARFTGTAHNY